PDARPDRGGDRGERGHGVPCSGARGRGGLGIGWVSYKGPPPVSPGKTRVAEFVEAHPVPERFVLPEDIEDWTKIKQH
ncbi:MAG: hypothetical protein OXP07_22310, partial [Defluviicoccus sp.]|nr:hypothetical protein [Defluviicoccus sp.]